MTCQHENLAEVIPHGSVQVVGLICEDCLADVPINHDCPDCDWAEVRTMSAEPVMRVLACPCDKHREVVGWTHAVLSRAVQAEQHSADQL